MTAKQPFTEQPINPQETTMVSQDTTYAYTEAKPAMDAHGGLLCPFCKHEDSNWPDDTPTPPMPPMPDTDDGYTTELVKRTCDNCGTVYRYYFQSYQGSVHVGVQQLRITKASK